MWAEENTREAIFDALRRREAYATSGTRLIVRFFGGAELPADRCGRADFAAQGYAAGVPMGGLLLAAKAGAAAPRFALRALKDPAGVRLARIQVVKVWVDAAGEPQEAVHDVTPAPLPEAAVDLATCAPDGGGQDELCAVWTDPTFDPARPALWYARVIEAPTCRWNRWLCLREGVDCAEPDAWEGCCHPDVPQTLQERAWTSPIWYDPPAAGR